MRNKGNIKAPWGNKKFRRQTAIRREKKTSLRRVKGTLFHFFGRLRDERQVTNFEISLPPFQSSHKITFKIHNNLKNKNRFTLTKLLQIFKL